MKKIESGRSMIEMLGVLAIIGVLSIGGLAAYSAAMDRHKANEVMSYASLCAVEAKISGVGACSDLTDATVPAGMTSAAASAGANGKIDVTITGLETGLAAIIEDKAAAYFDGTNKFTY